MLLNYLFKGRASELESKSSVSKADLLKIRLIRIKCDRNPEGSHRRQKPAFCKAWLLIFTVQEADLSSASFLEA